MLDLNKQIRDLINKAVGKENYAIKADQDAPRPRGEYCTVKIFNVEIIGRHDLNKVDIEDGITNNYEVFKKYTLDINLYRDVDNIKGHLLQTYFKVTEDIKVLSVSNVQNITEALSAGYEFRSNLQITVSIIDRISEDISNIETVIINNELKVEV